MHRRRMNHLGLAEIVGTLMLVLIVVAAATAFAFFVSSEEQINLNEQTQLHFKNLENVSIQSIETIPASVGPPPIPPLLVLVVSSSDIYATNVTDIAVGGDPATTFCQTPEDGAFVNCSNPATNFQTFSGAGGQGYLNLTPFTVTAVTIAYTSFYIQPFVFSTTSVQVQMGTTRGNEFVETLFPPIAEIAVNLLTGYPVLDGTQSYQPHTGSSPDTTIVDWVWTIFSVTDANYSTTPTYYGQEVQLPHPFITTPSTTYTITLTVTNTLGLSGSTSQNYVTP